MLQAIGGEVTSQDLNDNFSFLDSEKLGKTELPFILSSNYGFVNDGITDNISALTAVIATFPSGATIVFKTGIYYFSNENNLPIIENFHFIGRKGVVFKFGEVCGDNTNYAPLAAETANWKSCTFDKMEFTAPTAIGYAIFTSGSRDLTFNKCRIFDVKSHFIQRTEDRVKLYKCRYETPTLPGQCLMTTGNVTKDFEVDRCIFDYQPMDGPVSVITATRDDRLIGNYRITNNMFLKKGYSADASVDLEPENVNLKDVLISGNLIYNSKIYIGSGDNVKVDNNTLYFSADNYGPAASPIKGYNAYTSKPMGRVEITNNRIVLEDFAGFVYKQPISFKFSNTIEELIIRGNKLLTNGKLTGSYPNSVIYISTALGTINSLVIDDNSLGYTSIPTTKNPYIEIDTDGLNTVNRLSVRNNDLIGVKNASSYFIKSVSGSGVASTTEAAVILNNNLAGYGLTDVKEGSPNVFTSLKIDTL